jgi:hypothetical protein
LDIPLVEEIAADIFMGNFTAKYTRAAGLAAEVVHGTVHAKYKIDPGALKSAVTDGPGGAPIDLGTVSSKRVAALTSPHNTLSPSLIVRNGQTIEQCQILTTHNLAAFVTLGIKVDWYAAAIHAWHVTKSLLVSAGTLSRNLGTIKNPAYSWRQALFFLSMAENDNAGVVQPFISAAAKEVETLGEATLTLNTGNTPRFALLLAGLDDVATPAVTLQQPPKSKGRIFYGWSQGPHWILTKDPSNPPSARKKDGLEGLGDTSVTD